MILEGGREGRLFGRRGQVMDLAQRFFDQDPAVIAGPGGGTEKLADQAKGNAAQSGDRMERGNNGFVQ